MPLLILPREKPNWQPEWTLIERGQFHVGPPLIPIDDRLIVAEQHDVDYQIGRFAITNRKWREFLVAEAEALKTEGLWFRHAFPAEATGWRAPFSVPR